MGPGRLLPWALLAVLVLALGLRLHGLDGQSLWYDEAVTAQVVQQGLGELAQWTADDIQPPLYYAVVAGWTRLAGTGEWALRFPSAAFGVLAVALACVLGRRLFGWGAGLLAGLLGAVHPLWLYYSQEARMYTMLMALGMVAGYALLRALGVGDAGWSLPARGGRAGWWLALAAAALAMLYTHYFALFLLLALAIFFGIVLAVTPRPERRRLLGEGLLVAGGVWVLYLPWLPNAIRRFNVDASFWRGTLKLDEALRHVAISFSTGETVLESQATPLAGVVLGLGGLAVVLLLWQAIRGRRSQLPTGLAEPAQVFHPSSFLSLLFVLLYLLVPVVCILALSYRNPKFNPRYLMLASPALVLLLAGGVAVLLAPGNLPGARSSPGRGLWRAAGVAGLGVVLAVSLYADRNWFADPAFAKDDWRGAVGLVKSRLATDEAVVLVSGHAYPAWRYYAPEIEPLRLPDTPTLDVNAVLDLETAASLNEALAGKLGAWLVQWQEEVVDPTDVVPLLLSSAGAARPVAESFQGLGSPRHYRFAQPIGESPGTTFSAQPAIEVPVMANFGDQVELLGFSQPSCEAGIATCPVHLYWRAEAPLSADLKLSATLFDGSGLEVGAALEDRRLAAYGYPTFRWQPGTVVHSELALAPGPGTPPGDYRVRLGVYDDATGEALDVLDAASAPQGPWTWLEPVAVQALVTPGQGEGPPVGAGVRLAPEITLQDLSVGRAAGEPGDAIPVEAWWVAEQQPAKDYVISWQWIDPEGEVASEGTRPPGGDGFPTARWPAGALVRSRFDLMVPQEAAPGAWVLRFGLQDAAAAGGSLGVSAPAWDVPVVLQPTSRLFEPSATPVYAAAERFGEVIELLGASVATEPVLPGARVPITVAWRGLRPMDISYTGFVHLLDEDGRLVAQDDHEPRQGQRPTTAWVAGEVVEDRYELSLPAGLPAGTYRLEIGLYDANRPGLPRLRVEDGRDSILLGEIAVGG